MEKFFKLISEVIAFVFFITNSVSTSPLRPAEASVSTLRPSSEAIKGRSELAEELKSSIDSPVVPGVKASSAGYEKEIAEQIAHFCQALMPERKTSEGEYIFVEYTINSLDIPKLINDIAKTSGRNYAVVKRQLVEYPMLKDMINKYGTKQILPIEIRSDSPALELMILIGKIAAQQKIKVRLLTKIFFNCVKPAVFIDRFQSLGELKNVFVSDRIGVQFLKYLPTEITWKNLRGEMKVSPGAAYYDKELSSPGQKSSSAGTTITLGELGEVKVDNTLYLYKIGIKAKETTGQKVSGARDELVGIIGEAVLWQRLKSLGDHLEELSLPIDKRAIEWTFQNLEDVVSLITVPGLEEGKYLIAATVRHSAESDESYVIAMLLEQSDGHLFRTSILVPSLRQVEKLIQANAKRKQPQKILNILAEQIKEQRKVNLSKLETHLVDIGRLRLNLAKIDTLISHKLLPKKKAEALVNGLLALKETQKLLVESSETLRFLTLKEIKSRFTFAGVKISAIISVPGDENAFLVFATAGRPGDKIIPILVHRRIEEVLRTLVGVVKLTPYQAMKLRKDFSSYDGEYHILSAYLAQCRTETATTKSSSAGTGFVVVEILSMGRDDLLSEFSEEVVEQLKSLIREVSKAEKDSHSVFMDTIKQKRYPNIVSAIHINPEQVEVRKSSSFEDIYKYLILVDDKGVDKIVYATIVFIGYGHLSYRLPEITYVDEFKKFILPFIERLRKDNQEAAATHWDNFLKWIEDEKTGQAKSSSAGVKTDDKTLKKKLLSTAIAAGLSFANLASPLLSQPQQTQPTQPTAIKAPVDTAKVQELFRRLKEDLEAEGINVAARTIYELDSINAFTEGHIPLLLDILVRKDHIITFVIKSGEEETVFLNPATLPLAKFGNASVPELMRLADNKDEVAQVNAIKTFGHIDSVSDEIMDMLGRKLESKRATVREAALYALAQKGGSAKVFLPKILKILDNETDKIGIYEIEWATAILNNIGFCNESVLSNLVRCIGKRDDRAGYSAAVAIGKFGPIAKNVIPELIKIIEQNELNWRVAIHAREALEGIGADAIPALKDALSSEKPWVRRNALEALYNMRQLLNEVDLAVIYARSLQDEDAAIRAKALRGLCDARLETRKAMLPAILQVCGEFYLQYEKPIYYLYDVNLNLAGALLNIGLISDEEAKAYNIAPMGQLVSRLLHKTVQTVPNLTDIGLEILARADGKLMKDEVNEVLGTPNVAQQLSIFDGLYPRQLTTEQAVIILDILMRNIKAGITWAASDAEEVYRFLRLYQIGKESKLAKLFVLSGILPLPVSINAEFQWSSAPDMPISIGELDWSLQDMPFLVQMYEKADSINNPKLKTGIEIAFLKLHSEYVKRLFSPDPPKTSPKVVAVMRDISKLKDDVMGRLKDLIESENSSERRYAAYCLGILGSAYAEESEPILLRALAFSKKTGSREIGAIIDALRRIGAHSKQTISALTAQLDRTSYPYDYTKGGTFRLYHINLAYWIEEFYYPYNIIMTLGEIGPEAKEALPVLKRLEKYAVPRKIIEQAIKRIESDTESQKQVPAEQLIPKSSSAGVNIEQFADIKGVESAEDFLCPAMPDDVASQLARLKEEIGKFDNINLQSLNRLIAARREGVVSKRWNRILPAIGVFPYKDKRLFLLAVYVGGEFRDYNPELNMLIAVSAEKNPKYYRVKIKSEPTFEAIIAQIADAGLLVSEVISVYRQKLSEGTKQLAVSVDLVDGPKAQVSIYPRSDIYAQMMKQNEPELWQELKKVHATIIENKPYYTSGIIRAVRGSADEKGLDLDILDKDTFIDKGEWKKIPPERRVIVGTIIRDLFSIKTKDGNREFILTAGHNIPDISQLEVLGEDVSAPYISYVGVVKNIKSSSAGKSYKDILQDLIDLEAIRKNRLASTLRVMGHPEPFNRISKATNKDGYEDGLRLVRGLPPVVRGNFDVVMEKNHGIGYWTAYLAGARVRKVLEKTAKQLEAEQMRVEKSSSAGAPYTINEIKEDVERIHHSLTLIGQAA